MADLPSGDPAPQDGALPDSALADVHAAPFGIYVHVPYCATRCGYCDFNTYALTEVASGVGPATFAATAEREVDLARTVLGPHAPMVDTIFFGGGTPTLLPVADLAGMLDAITTRFEVAPGAEITTEANPDSLGPGDVEALAEAGFTRVSIGMQSVVPHVLATLDRTHAPERVAPLVAAAKEAGLATSVDLIYGTPGESLQDWRASVEAAIALGVDHVSAYALVVEAGTALAANVRRGRVPAPDDDDEAEKYEAAREALHAAGYDWYEVSNFARDARGISRHNQGYWNGGNWWGVGPGAHSHVGGVRWWNVKHPRAYGERLAAGHSPAAGREALTPEQRYDERVMLAVRTRDGLPIDELAPPGRQAVADLVAWGLIDGPQAVRQRRVVLTDAGLLLADGVVRRLLGF